MSKIKPQIKKNNSSKSQLQHWVAHFWRGVHDWGNGADIIRWE
ncbi:hypothetical protein [Helicobacter pylori]